MSDAVIAQFYVAITRSEKSVAILTEKKQPYFKMLKEYNVAQN